MRITEGMIASDYLFSVNKARERIMKLQNDLASGKRVHTVSDDPTAADVILRLNAAMDRNEQYQKNVVDGQGFLAGSASALDGIGSLLQEAQEIIVRATDGQQAGSLAALADRVDQMINEAVSLGNTQFNGKYIFGGAQTTTPPYEAVSVPGSSSAGSVVYRGDGSVVHYPAGDGVMQQVSVPGSEAFGGTAAFDALLQLRNSLRAGVSPPAADRAAVAGAFTTVNQTASKIGSLMQSADNTTMHLEEQRTQLMMLLSSEQDTDVAEATLRLKQEETMLNAALTTGARVIPKSLLDFLR